MAEIFVEKAWSITIIHPRSHRQRSLASGRILSRNDQIKITSFVNKKARNAIAGLSIHRLFGLSESSQPPILGTSETHVPPELGARGLSWRETVFLL